MLRKVLQVHPSQYCNYSCLHCYSSSSPFSKDGVDSGLLISAVKDAAKLGFERLSISGGEPLLFSDLANILMAAKDEGMITSVVTNGSFPEKKYAQLEGLLDIIGVSLDGPKDLHNHIRQNTSAFDKVDQFLGFASRYCNSVGIVFALTDQSWESIPEMLNYAKEKKVDFFQIHPLENVGRAEKNSRLNLSSINLKRAFILTKSISCGYTFQIQMDVLTKELAKQSMVPDCESILPVEAIDLLVLNEKGLVLPYTYGLDSRWSIADLNCMTLLDGWKVFEQNKIVAFRHWCLDQVELVDEVIFPPSTLFVNEKTKTLTV